MFAAAEELRFDYAAELRDEIKAAAGARGRDRGLTSPRAERLLDSPAERARIDRRETIELGLDLLEVGEGAGGLDEPSLDQLRHVPEILGVRALELARAFRSALEPHEAADERVVAGVGGVGVLPGKALVEPVLGRRDRRGYPEPQAPKSRRADRDEQGLDRFDASLEVLDPLADELRPRKPRDRRLPCCCAHSLRIDRAPSGHSCERPRSAARLRRRRSSAIRRAAFRRKISSAPSDPRRRPSARFGMVKTLSQLAAHSLARPWAGPSETSVGRLRIRLVTATTQTLRRRGIARSRVTMTAGCEPRGISMS